MHLPPNKTIPKVEKNHDTDLHFFNISTVHFSLLSINHFHCAFQSFVHSSILLQLSEVRNVVGDKSYNYSKLNSEFHKLDHDQCRAIVVLRRQIDRVSRYGSFSSSVLSKCFIKFAISI